MKITNLKLTLRNDPKKIKSILKTKNADLWESLEKRTSKFEILKEDHEELHMYSIIVKGELTQCKQQLEKLHFSREKLEDSMSIQRPAYDKTDLGYLFNMSTKKPKIRNFGWTKASGIS